MHCHSVCGLPCQLNPSAQQVLQHQSELPACRLQAIEAFLLTAGPSGTPLTMQAAVSEAYVTVIAQVLGGHILIDPVAPRFGNMPACDLTGTASFTNSANLAFPPGTAQFVWKATTAGNASTCFDATPQKRWDECCHGVHACMARCPACSVAVVLAAHPQL